MFEKIKAMGDFIKGTFDNVKAAGKMDKLVEKARSEYKDKHRPADNAFYLKFKKAAEKLEAAPEGLSNEEVGELSSNKEAAQLFYLSTLAKNTALPAEFRTEIQTVIEEYKQSTPEEILKKSIMRVAKTEEEKQIVLDIFNEAMNE